MEKYNELIAILGKYLKAKGWIKKAATFYLNKDDNWGLINFQSSMESSAFEKKFTINLGISSTVIRKFDEEKIENKPNIIDCHWTARIGQLLENGTDTWWTITEETKIEQLAPQLIVAIDSGIQAIEEKITDRGLIEYWSRNETQGPVELKRLTYLTTLLRYYNLPEYRKALEDFSRYCEKHNRKFLVTAHLKQLNDVYGSK